MGEEALAAVLPAAVRRRVIDTATHPGDLLGGFDSSLTPTFEQSFPGAGPDKVSAIDRYAFRRALMTGLDEVLAFGKHFTSYAETGDGRVEIQFADGSTETADVLVGADGVGSRVRALSSASTSALELGEPALARGVWVGGWSLCGVVVA
ncbi:hypothetical protein F1D05_26750 [Kribbella qitaiheensis]|uniref:FAD-binding domain-containing protein n=1 Tax=Kribbella qitaiheensis TaxID=1544730 RepID=A0A7G6X3P0_9ACTN|nr:hypothetical protein [Kribbella qitaiheensis]QNE20855.1 hypothetical protein F1D05_26750 [Kribbella qitaiheensis]